MTGSQVGTRTAIIWPLAAEHLRSFCPEGQWRPGQKVPCLLQPALGRSHHVSHIRKTREVDTSSSFRAFDDLKTWLTCESCRS